MFDETPEINLLSLPFLMKHSVFHPLAAQGRSYLFTIVICTFVTVIFFFFSCTAVLAEFIKPDVECLELFARNLQPGWTSWGNEVLKFQHMDYFTLLQNENWVGSCSSILKFRTFPAGSWTCLYELYWWCSWKITEIKPVALQLKFLKW